MSESLARQNPKSPFRCAPSSLLHHQHHQQSQGGNVSAALVSTDTDELLKLAKDNIQNLKQKGKLVIPYCIVLLCMHDEYVFAPTS